MIVDTEKPSLKVNILEKEYHIICEDHECEPLTKAAQYLDSKMKEIRDGRKVVGAEAIAIMAALNMAHDYMLCMENSDPAAQMNNAKIKSIRDKVESALMQYQQMEMIQEC